MNHKESRVPSESSSLGLESIEVEGDFGSVVRCENNQYRITSWSYNYLEERLRIQTLKIQELEERNRVLEEDVSAERDRGDLINQSLTESEQDFNKAIHSLRQIVSEERLSLTKTRKSREHEVDQLQTIISNLKQSARNQASSNNSSLLEQLKTASIGRVLILSCLDDFNRQIMDLHREIDNQNFMCTCKQKERMMSLQNVK